MVVIERIFTGPSLLDLVEYLLVCVEELHCSVV